VITDVVVEDMGVKDKVPKFKMHKNIPLHIQELKCEKCIYELEDHVGEKTLGSNLPPKLGLAKGTHFASFCNRLLGGT
jgi:hypothetical protein